MQHLGTEALETERLLLRRFTPGDAQAMFKNWAAEEAVTKYLTWTTHRDPSVSAEVLKEWVNNYSRKDYYQWAVVFKESGAEPIGSIAVVSQNETVSGMHIGYCIGSRWWHMGITSEALRAVIGFLFDRVGALRIDSRHDSHNPNSGAVMKKCGMKYEGTLRQADRNNQGICDVCYYSILKSEWQPELIMGSAKK